MNPLQYERVNGSIHESGDESAQNSLNTGRQKTISRKIWPLFLLSMILFLLIFAAIQYRRKHLYIYNDNDSENSNKDILYDLQLMSASNWSAAQFHVPLLYSDQPYSGLFLWLPMTLLKEDYLYIEQIIGGLGIRELWWDPGRILFQSIVYFKITANTTVSLNAKELSFRDNSSPSVTSSTACIYSSGVCQSFSESIITSFLIVRSNSTGILIDINPLVSTPSAGG